MALLDPGPSGSLLVLLAWEGLVWFVFWGSHTALWRTIFILLHSVSPAVSGCVLSEDIPGCQVFVIKIWDVMVSAWKG